MSNVVFSSRRFSYAWLIISSVTSPFNVYKDIQYIEYDPFKKKNRLLLAWVERKWYIKSLIPIEVKANDNATPTLKKMTDGRYPDIKYAIKLCNRNTGFNGQFYTLPYFLTFLLKRWLRKTNSLDEVNQWTCPSDSSNNNYGTTVTIPVDTTVPTQLSQSYHSLGTSVSTAMEQLWQPQWYECVNRVFSFHLNNCSVTIILATMQWLYRVFWWIMYAKSNKLITNIGVVRAMFGPFSKYLSAY